MSAFDPKETFGRAICCGAIIRDTRRSGQSECDFAQRSQPPFPGALPREITKAFATVHFRPDRFVLQDSVATSAGLQPFDPTAA
jgi:hypothetical protein